MKIASRKLMSVSLDPILEISLTIPFNNRALGEAMNIDQYFEFIAKDASELILNTLKDLAPSRDHVQKLSEKELAESKESLMKILDKIDEKYKNERTNS
jgi:hypothetical protein